jgi:hypothetical protein
LMVFRIDSLKVFTTVNFKILIEALAYKSLFNHLPIPFSSSLSSDAGNMHVS